MYRLLIADDEIVERAALIYIVKEHFAAQFEIFEAENGKNAVQKAGELQPDIILMDIKMPVMNGIDAAKEILKRLPDCKIVMLTGFTYFNYARDSVSIGALDFLVKPARDETVVETLQTAMEAVEVVRQTRSTAQRQQQKMILADTYLETELLAEMAFCGIEEEQIAANLQELAIDEGYFTAAVLFLDAEYGSHGVAQRIEDACRMSVEAIAQANLRVLLCEHYGRIYLLLVTHEALPHSFYMNYLEHLLRLTTARQQCVAGIGVSEQSRFCAEIPLLFRQAHKAYRQTNAIQFYTAEKCEKSSAQFNQRAVEQALCSQFKERRYAELLSRLYLVIDHLFEKSAEPRGQLCEILIILSRTAAEFVEVESTYALYEKLRQMENEEKVRRYATHFVQGLIDRRIASDAGNREWVDTVTKKLHASFTEDLSLDEVARDAGFSIYYFSRLFKQEFGVSFVDYITALRIRQAKFLLCKPNMSVKEVCYQVGYSEPNYFTRVFKKETGMTPSEYQKNADGAK